MFYRKQYTGILLAAGRSSRYSQRQNKLLEYIGKYTVIEHSALVLSFCCEEIILALTSDLQNETIINRLIKNLQSHNCQLQIVHGGERRQDSVWAAINKVHSEFVIIHDAARPLLHREDLDNLCQASKPDAGVILATPLADTLKAVHDNCIQKTIDRRGLYCAMTPQLFCMNAYQKALRMYLAGDRDQEFTDDAALLEWAGINIAVMMAKYPNPKLTTPADLFWLRALAGQSQYTQETPQNRP